MTDQSIILYSTPTSGTGSLVRIIEALNGGRMTFVRYFRDVLQGLSREEIERTVPPKTGHILLHNSAGRFNRKMPLADYRFLVNFRDPRDRLCNIYHWQFSHPAAHETEAETRARRERVRAQGIDAWILSRLETPAERRFYDTYFWLLEQAPAENVLLATYARLCCDFDGLIASLITFTGFTPDARCEKALALERPEALAGNPRWIGNKWEGSDILPGRHLHELQPETIAQLNSYFAPVLRKMARHDPQFADQYLAGVAARDA
ncbi:hypothetical protein ACFQXB_05550 [Plastorhodobacter daqingensis]|uniref:Sulfotransferase domain-containing protein n=1 Tax=Plastorhodobacter daqingensis TaxID=1387281 RepID=A0ABW2UG61_9RHOB